MLMMVISFLFTLVSCQEKEDDALTCEFDGTTYAVGESFDSSDDCNSCSCDAFGDEIMISCTEMDCSSIEDPEPEADCVELSVSDCAETEACVVITASEVILDTEEECFAWANSVDNVGCMPAEIGCGAAITYAASAEEPTLCYGFTNTCIPDGWNDCSLESYPDCQ